VSIAATLAAKSATSLYDLVKRKFAGRKEAVAALAAGRAALPRPGVDRDAVLTAALKNDNLVDTAWPGTVARAMRAEPRRLA